MKKNIIRTLFLLMIMVSVTIFTVSAEEVAATVELTRKESVSVSELEQRYQQYVKEAAAAGSNITIKPIDVLNVMINDLLVIQGAQRDGYAVTDAQADTLVAQQKAYLEQQAGQSITDQQFELAVKQSYGLTLDEFKKTLQDSSSVDRYVRGTQNAVIESYREPTEEEISAFYRANRAQFMNPELVRISHIFMPFENEDKADVKKQMDQLARYLKYNTYTFEELVPKYSKDADSALKGGDIGWLSYDDADLRKVLGDQFFEEVFSLQLGKPSGVIESPSGYHIVKVTTHTEPKLLSIDDRINPESTTTVKQYIAQTLSARYKQSAYLKAIDTLVETLRSQAEIKIEYTGDDNS
ncbi:MAG: peptidylprolyl isomerase [Sphaerochaetaceae bacterium]|nr:peptidylprolyl isomerase [Sphaerochaetaceae bacterium]